MTVRPHTFGSAPIEDEPLHSNYRRNKLSPSDIDHIVSKGLMALSIAERNALTNEIHGVGLLAPKESPELLASALLELDSEIKRISDHDLLKAAYLKSQEFEETYVNTRDFRLRFLRCDLFDAKKAAIRMLKFLDLMAYLFGTEVLVKPVQTTNFSVEEMKIIRTGPVQLLPYRDRSGRPVVVWVDDFGCQTGTPEFRAKYCLYMLWSVGDDVESQQKGLVHVTWPGNGNIKAPLPKINEMKIMTKLMESSPIRICACHLFLPDKPYFHVLRTMVSVCMSNFRNRTKFHVGEITELQYAGRSYGLPLELIPMTGTGNVKTGYQRQWLRVRKKLETMRASGSEEYSSVIEMPRSTDVIFRTGNSLTCHPGNAMFQNVIQSKVQDHHNASQVEKMAITRDIIEEIKSRNGRFLQWEKRGWWTEIKGQTQIHAKVAVSVRDFKSKLVARVNCLSFASDTSLFQNQDGKRRKLDYSDSACDCNILKKWG